MKRLLSILLVSLLLVSFTSPAYASTEIKVQDSIIQPFWTYISTVSAWMDIDSSGNALMASSMSAYSTVTKIEISAYLQRLEDGEWKTVNNWSETSSGTSGTWTQTWYVNKGYSYRLKTYFYAYKGASIVESTSLTSSTVRYY